MTRDDCRARIAAQTDAELRDLLDMLCDCDEFPDVPDRDEKIAMAAEEIERRPFASMLVPEEGETSSDPSAVALALARWSLFGECSPAWVERRRAERAAMASAGTAR